ncbi:hypothetical protein AB0C33_01920 [Nonomuraea sp. NPDC048881]|uniref:hypothetical protein n=1 Tax=Nonomuraea sp. NPDC048881 TaxID=3155030 RepID=UPI0034081A6A
MEWWQRLGIAGAALRDSWSSFWDVANGVFGEDDKTFEEVLRTAARVPVGLGNAAFQTVASPVQGIAEGLSWAEDKATYPLRAAQGVINLSQSPTWAKQQGYGPPTEGVGPFPDVYGQALLDPATYSKGWDLAANTSIGQGGWMGGSPVGGGALSVFSGALGTRADVLDDRQVAELKNDTLFNVVTGLTDAAATWYLDPVTKVARVGEAAQNVSKIYGMGSHAADPWLERQLFQRTKLGVKETDPDVFAHSDRVNEFLAWASGKSARQIIEHPMIAQMSKKDDAAGILAGLLDEQDVDTARLVIAHGFGSLTARQALAERADGLARRIQSVNNLSNRPLALAIVNKSQTGQWLPPSPVQSGIPKGTPPLALANVKAAARLTRKQQATVPAWTTSKVVQGVLGGLSKAQIEKDPKTLGFITSAIGSRDDAGGIWGDMVFRVPRMSDSRKADRAIAYQEGSFSKWSENFIPGKAFDYGTRVVTYPGFKLAHGFTDKRPPTWFDVNRKDTSPALHAYMRHAGVFDEAQINGRMNEYLTAMDMGQRTEVIRKTEKEALIKLGMRYGLSKKQALLIAEEGIGRRNKLIAKIKSGEAEGDQVYGVYDEDGNFVKWALFETQEVNSVPLKDLKAYERIFEKHGDTLRTMGLGDKSSGKQFLEDAFEVFNGVWSATNLLRVGYTVRNLTDDTLRALASLGAMGVVGNLGAGFRAGLRANAAIRLDNAYVRSQAAGSNAAVRLTARLLDADPVETRRMLAESYDQMGRDLGSVVTQSALGFNYRGHAYRAPYDGRAETYQYVVGSSFNNITNTAADILANLRRHHAQWDVVTPDMVTHMDSWVHAIHNQIGKSELGRKFLEGMSGDEVLRWLTRTKDGRAVLSRLGRKDKHNPREAAWAKKSSEEIEELVGRAQAVVDNYVPMLNNLPDPLMLRRLALEGKVTRDVLEDLFPDQAVRPTVHGPTVDLNLSQGSVYDKIEAITNFGFKWLGQVPTDKLVRHPVFRRLYINNVKRYHNVSETQLADPAKVAELQKLGRVTADGKWTSDHLRQVEHIARERSLKQINELLYDGSTKSDIAHKLRFVSAFFSAWEDSLTKWARIAMDKPQTLIQGAKLWNAPNEMNLGATEDEAGNIVPRFTVKTKDDKGEWVKDPGSWNPLDWNREAKIEVRLPEEFAKRIPGFEGGSFEISKPSMNLVLQGDPWWLPGAGPLVQYGVGQFADHYPTTLPEVYKWAIPFGSEDNFVYGLLPAWMRRLWDSGESISDGSRATAFASIAQSEIMRAKLGKRTMPSEEAFFKEIEDRTDAYFKLRAFTSFIAPFSVQYKSPYQFYIDRLQGLRAQEKPGDEMSADERFLASYGNDFYIFTMSMSKNATGLPASREAWDKSQKVKELIAKDPDLASIYVGQINNPEFDQYVYDAQKRQKLGPGSKETARQERSPKEALDEAEVKQGFREFGQYMDVLDGMLPYKDIPLDFIDFARKKLAMRVAERYPKWAEEYYKTDPNKVPATIEKLQTYLVQNPRELLKPEMQTLAMYLRDRETMLGVLDELKKQGLPHTLQAEANRDLAVAWKSTQEQYAERNTVFSRIFWRYLSNDRLQRRVGEEEE